jgi:hypothetical protein
MEQTEIQIPFNDSFLLIEEKEEATHKWWEISAFCTVTEVEEEHADPKTQILRRISLALDEESFDCFLDFYLID